MGKIEELISTYETVVKIADDYLKYYNNDKVKAEKQMAIKIIKDLNELKSSLPTQQDKVVVPPYVGELICWVQKNNAVPSDVISDFYSLAVDEINLPSTLELKKISAYFTIACHRFDFEKACIIGYTVEKEQLYYVPFGYDRFLVKSNAKFSDGTDFIWIETLEEIEQQGIELKHHFTEKEIKAIDKRYWAFAVPVETNYAESSE